MRTAKKTLKDKDRKMSYTVSLSPAMKNDLIKEYKSLTNALCKLWESRQQPAQ